MLVVAGCCTLSICNLYPFRMCCPASCAGRTLISDPLAVSCRAKLYEMELQKHAREQSAQRKAAAGNANTNERIRSYNYQDGRVVDHRVGLNMNIDVPRFIEGGRLGEVIAAVKLAHQQQLLQEMLAEG